MSLLSVCFDSHISRLTSVINTVVSLQMKWHEVTYLQSRLCTATLSSCNTHWCTTKTDFSDMKQGKINGTRRRESRRKFVGFKNTNVIFDSLVFAKYNIKKSWSHSRPHWCRSTMRFLLSQHWADYQLWNSRLPSAQTSGHACASTSQGLPVSSIDWMLWFYLSSAASRAYSDRSDIV